MGCEAAQVAQPTGRQQQPRVPVEDGVDEEAVGSFKVGRSPVRKRAYTVVHVLQSWGQPPQFLWVIGFVVFWTFENFGPLNSQRFFVVYFFPLIASFVRSFFLSFFFLSFVLSFPSFSLSPYIFLSFLASFFRDIFSFFFLLLSLSLQPFHC